MPWTEALLVPLRIICSEAEIFVVGPDHLRQIWGYTKEAADFVETIFKVGGLKCGHCLGSTIKPNTENPYKSNPVDFLMHVHRELGIPSDNSWYSMNGSAPRAPSDNLQWGWNLCGRPGSPTPNLGIHQGSCWFCREYLQCRWLEMRTLPWQHH